MPQNTLITVLAAVMMCSVVSTTVAFAYMVWESRSASICKAAAQPAAKR